MGNLPYYKLYPKEFDADEHVRMMELAELGLFMRALNHAWVNDGLPLEHEAVRRLLKTGKKDFARAWPAVERCFPVAQDGRRRNEYQEQQRAEAMLKQVRARAASSRAASSRRYANRSESHSGQRNDDHFVDDISRAEHESGQRNDDRNVGNFPYAYGFLSDSLEKKTSTEKCEMRPEFDEQWLEFTRLFAEASANPTIPEDFHEAWYSWRMLDHEQKCHIINGLKERIEARQFVLHKAANYLRKREWKRAVQPLRTRDSEAVEHLRRVAEAGQ
jgi:hypothetical protein